MNEDTSRLLHALAALLDANPGIESAGPSALAGATWPASEVDRGPLADALRAYQRLARVVARADRAVILGLLARGVESAIHIAAIPRPRFVAEFAALFDGDPERARELHQAALDRRSELALRYVQARQNLELRARPLTARGAKD
ncbi:hypothetical protein ACNOYE_33320 [Nannocystaceae bacterium ST9]